MWVLRWVAEVWCWIGASALLRVETTKRRERLHPSPFEIPQGKAGELQRRVVGSVVERGGVEVGGIRQWAGRGSRGYP